MQYIILIKR